MWGDAGYVGVQKRAQNLGLAVAWQVRAEAGAAAEVAPPEPGGAGGEGEGVDPGHLWSTPFWT